ncbi:MAG: DUF1819 family protein [Eubacterium sp.]|nr:DUF1819 family protein [Eubacterium sp.]
MVNLQLNSPYKGSGSLTREQFLFYEMRTTAKLMSAFQLIPCQSAEDAVFKALGVE